jgi:hypothetical protein
MAGPGRLRWPQATAASQIRVRVGGGTAPGGGSNVRLCRVGHHAQCEPATDDVATTANQPPMRPHGPLT